MKFTKSLKFKLTLWYSLILSVFCIAFVASINIWLTNYMQNITTEPESYGHGFLIERTDRPRLRALSQEQRLLIIESRLEDLENIRKITIYMIFPLILLSFGGGYLIASIMLKPLENLNEKIKKKETENLSEQIDYEDNGDEISELIKSFNRMSNRLAKAFDSQKEFVENASHELKTPLTVIQANIDTILEGKKVPSKETNRLLANSKKQVLFMNELTEDLLLLSSISTSKVVLKFEDTSIVEIIEGAVNILGDTLEESKINLTLNVLNQRDIKVRGNEVLLLRAFTNVLDNAIKYSKGKNIWINVKEVNEEIVISIKDDGKGIPKSKAKKIFDRFYRIDIGRSRQDGGSGLGLAITKEVIERHNGKIFLNKRYKKGAEFTIKLPKTL